MPKIRQPQEPFGDVNVIVKEKHIEVVVSILMVPTIEGAQVAIALDGSKRIEPSYRKPLSSSLFKEGRHEMECLCKTLASYMTSFSGDGKVHLGYYSCGKEGENIEPLAPVSESNDGRLVIEGPKDWGGKSSLLPGVKHFMGSLDPKKWTMIIFLTDGNFQDMAKVKEFSLQVGQEIVAKKRAFVKFSMIGVGEGINEAQMEELDDMFEGSDLSDADGNGIDLWCHRQAGDMNRIEDIFAEIASENVLVAPQGRVLDQNRKEIALYSDGLPSKLRFHLPPGSTSFTVEYPGGKITQDITSARA